MALSDVVPTAAPSGQLLTSQQWHAYLSLEIASSTRGSVLRRSRHQGPLYVQKAFYPEGKDHPHLYILHPPGGMVSGDRLSIEVNVGAEAGCLVTTPGAGRVYRARPDLLTQYQTISLTVAQGGLMEWVPLENIIFNGAHTDLKTEINLDKGAQLVAWDVTCLGLPARNETFESGSLRQSFSIRLDGRLALREVLRVDDYSKQVMQAKAGLDGQAVNGLMVAGPWDKAQLDEATLSALQDLCADWSGKAGNTAAGVSETAEFLTIRCVGECSERARLLFTECWMLLRPVLTGRPGCKPRIWAT